MLKGKTIIAERLRQLRGTSSLREMADAVGIKYSAWARYEAGGSLPGADILARICCVHACSADWLLGLPKSAAQTAAQTAAQSAAKTDAVPGEMAACSKCPFKKAAENFQKILPQKVPRKVPRK